MAGDTPCGVACRECDTIPVPPATLSATGLCEPCWTTLLTDNARGLRDEHSDAYRRWRVAYRISLPGRGAFTTPSPAYRWRAARKSYRLHHVQIDIRPPAE